MVRVFSTVLAMHGKMKMMSPLLMTPRTLSSVAGVQRAVITAAFTLSPSSSSSAVTASKSHTTTWRLYSSSTPKPGVEEAQTLIEREYFSKVRKRLESDTRKKISYQEFVEICSKEGLNKEQAKQLSQSLSDAGIILHFGNSNNAILRDYLFLKPAEFNTTVSRILAELSDDTYIREEIATKKSELTQLKEELHPLEAQRELLERRSERRAKTIIWAGLGYCLVQAGIVARLTWWELSWDVMEPVTYMLTFATALIGYTFFVMTGSEYTYEGLRKTLEMRRLRQLIKRTGFDEAKYQKLRQAVQIREHDVARLLEDIRSDPVTLHLKNPANPVV